MPAFGFIARNLSSTKTIIRRRWPERRSPIRHCSSTNNTYTGLFQSQQQSRRETMSNPNKTVDKMQQLVNSDSTGGWEKCWEEGTTPWDLGQPTPVLLHLLRSGALPKGRALIPGCGSGYDVVAIADPERYVVGLDISETAVRKAKELSSSSPNSDYMTFLTEDFFTWHPDELFDLIFDYTFFCALEPNMRSVWASRIHDLLKEDGELITLMFPVSDHVGGPPYKVSVADYKEVLNPIGFKDVCIMDNELAVGARKGKEKVGRWKRWKATGGLSLL